MADTAIAVYRSIYKGIIQTAQKEIKEIFLSYQLAQSAKQRMQKRNGETARGIRRLTQKGPESRRNGKYVRKSETFSRGKETAVRMRRNAICMKGKAELANGKREKTAQQ